MKKTFFGLGLIALFGGAAFLAWEKFHHHAEHAHGSAAKAAPAEGEGGAASLNFTHFSDRTELFVEFPPLVAGHPSAFAAHLTRLADFKPVNQGRVSVTLTAADGSPPETFSVDAPGVPGIFRPIAKPARAGQRRLTVELVDGDLRVTHDLGEITVYPSAQSAARALAADPGGDKGGIAFSKEQQWQVDFALTSVAKRTLRDTVSATGSIRPQADGEALLIAASAGQVSTEGTFPRIGMRVQKGQVLASLVPRLGGDTDLATLETAARQARTRLEQATRERERMQALFAQEAVAEKRLFAAATEEKLAQAQLEASDRRYGQYAGKGGGIAIRAPISGVVGEVKVMPGAFVNDGQALFYIVNTGRLWLEAHIPESEVGRIVKPAGAWFRVDGFDRTFEIVDGRNGRVVAFSGVVDAATRTVALILEFPNPDLLLRVGMAARVHVVGSKTLQALAVPFSAVIDENGRNTVFVLKGGESFERRMVELGVRDGDWIGVNSGLAAGERVVSRNAYLVKLAGMAPAAAGHGHTH